MASHQARRQIKPTHDRWQQLLPSIQSYGSEIQAAKAKYEGFTVAGVADAIAEDDLDAFTDYLPMLPYLSQAKNPSYVGWLPIHSASYNDAHLPYLKQLLTAGHRADQRSY